MLQAAHNQIAAKIYLFIENIEFLKTLQSS